MTAEQISIFRAEVQTWTEQYTDLSGSRWRDPPWKAKILRLLEEREAVLKQLGNAAKALRFIHGGNTCAEQAARDVIAFAETHFTDSQESSAVVCPQHGESCPAMAAVAKISSSPKRHSKPARRPKA